MSRTPFMLRSPCGRVGLPAALPLLLVALTASPAFAADPAPAAVPTTPEPVQPPAGTPASPPSTVPDASSASSAPAAPPPVPGPALVAAPAPAPTTAPRAPAAPAPAPTPTSSFVEVVSKVPLRLYGIVHTAVIATQGVDTFGQPNASAATSAANPVLVKDPQAAELSFQVQQTRLGLVAGESTDVRAQVEIDFIHFDQSSPTTQAFPRIRIGLVEWNVVPDHKLFLGQTWDLFGNATGPQLLSHSYNLVGTLFRAGNIGFMRHQLGYSGRFGDVEIATALGMQGSNAGPTFTNLETSATPTGSARVMVHVGDHGVVGVSGIGTSSRYTLPTGEAERRAAFGGDLFGDLTFGPLNVHAETYLAQNVANLGALNLGQGRYGTDVADVGGYVSGKLKVDDHHAITAMVGAAAVLHPDDVVPGTSPAVVDATTGAVTTPAAPAPAAGPGITHNMSAHVGYWYSPIAGLSIVAEPYVYLTRFALSESDAGKVGPQTKAFGGVLGAMYSF